MKALRILPILALAGLLAIVIASSSSASAAAPATTDTPAANDAPATSTTSPAQEAVSANWAGYAVGDASSAFSSVSGSWVEPTDKCTTGAGDAAFWVGLGGTSEQSGSLEQIGTEANCTSSGAADYYAWYELVPAAPVRLDLSIRPGDRVSAKVAVSGTEVTVSLTDTTTGGSVTKTLPMSDPDTSSAEWIAEAPSTCADGTDECQPLPLADFGSVTFTGASATAGGHTGSISDSSWTAQPVELSGAGAGGGFGYPGFSADEQSSSPAGASPSALTSSGSSFSVTWSASAATSTASAGNGDGDSAGDGVGGDGGTGGYGGGTGYGGYGYGGYGYGGGAGGYGAATGGYSGGDGYYGGGYGSSGGAYGSSGGGYGY